MGKSVIYLARVTRSVITERPLAGLQRDSVQPSGWRQRKTSLICNLVNTKERNEMS